MEDIKFPIQTTVTLHGGKTWEGDGFEDDKGVWYNHDDVSNELHDRLRYLVMEVDVTIEIDEDGSTYFTHINNHRLQNTVGNPTRIKGT